MVTRTRRMKKILDIKKTNETHVLEVEYFDGAVNANNYTTRKVHFPSTLNADGAYISWFGEKKIVESFYL